jgi:polyhydroxyalkanoate synthesis regulator phasin
VHLHWKIAEEKIKTHEKYDYKLQRHFHTNLKNFDTWGQSKKMRELEERVEELWKKTRAC